MTQRVNEWGQQVGPDVPGWTPRAWPSATTLTGRYVVLHPLDVAHAEALQRAVAGPEDDPLWTYRPVDRPSDEAAMRAHLAALLARPDAETFTVTLRDGAPAGLTQLMRIETDHGQAEVAGVLYARSVQRTPASTEATHLLLRWLFDDLGYRRVEWKCDSGNEPSRRAAARLGFGYEGRFRQHLVVKGRNRDTDWFSLTDAEWPAVRAAHEAWLAPTNFDAVGTQRSRLSAPSV